MILDIKSKFEKTKIYNPPEDIKNKAMAYATENIDGKVGVYIISSIEKEKVLLFIKDNEEDAEASIFLYWNTLRKS